MHWTAPKAECYSHIILSIGLQIMLFGLSHHLRYADRAQFVSIIVPWGRRLERDPRLQSPMSMRQTAKIYLWGSNFPGLDKWLVGISAPPSSLTSDMLHSGLSGNGWGPCLGLNITYPCLIQGLGSLLGWLSLGVWYGQIYLSSYRPAELWHIIIVMLLFSAS